MKRHAHACGFSLIEMMIALVIMSMLGLMGWRGLDGLIRGKERIEGYSTEQRDLHYALTILNRDCAALVAGENINAPPVSIGKASTWWVRDAGTNNQPAWQLVGYTASADGLKRMITPPFTSRDSALEAWQELLKAPDKGYSKAAHQLLSSSITAQDVNILSGTPGLNTPVKALQFVWHLTSNDPANTRPLTRICLAGGA